MIRHLFVYGTLAPGQPNEHILKAIEGVWQKALVFGHLKQEGWGARMGYPGITLDEEGEQIHGQLFSSKLLENHWDVLDEFEGTEYQRELVNAHLSDGRVIKAYIYTIRAT